MTGVVFIISLVIAVSLCDAHHLGRRRFDIFEILQNQHTKDLQIEPVKLQFSLDSGENEEPTPLSKLLQLKAEEDKKKEQYNSLASDILKLFKELKDQETVKAKKKRPVIMVVAPNLFESNDHYHSDQGPLFVDNTRAKDKLKKGSEVVFNILPSSRGTEKKSAIDTKMKSILRSQDFILEADDRTEVPHGIHRPYADYQ